jgi:hypothetical protein
MTGCGWRYLERRIHMSPLLSVNNLDGARGIMLVTALITAAALTLGTAPRPANGQTKGPPTEEARPQGAPALETAVDPQESDVSLVFACATSVFCKDAGEAFSAKLGESEDLVGQTVVNLAGVPDSSGTNGDSAMAPASRTGRAVIWVAVMAALIVGGLLIAGAAT